MRRPLRTTLGVGVSTRVILEGWHGLSWKPPLDVATQSIRALRSILDIEHAVPERLRRLGDKQLRRHPRHVEMAIGRNALVMHGSASKIAPGRDRRSPARVAGLSGPKLLPRARRRQVCSGRDASTRRRRVHDGGRDPVLLSAHAFPVIGR